MKFRPYARMPRPLMWLARVVTTLVVLSLALAGAGVLAVRASFPQVSGDLKVKGLTGKVTVYRDKTGVPHIYADSSEDLFLAQGYVHAQDRFFEMDFRRHVTAGRLSEMFGPSTLPQDKAIRTMGWRRIAERELPLLSEQTRRYLDAYARGVNSWMEQHEGALGKSLEYGLLRITNSGYQPEPWTPVDSVAWLKAMAWDLRSNLTDEIGRALAASELPRERVEQLWPGYPFGAHRPIVTKGSVTDHGFDQAQEPRGATPHPEAGADPRALTGA
ncbi:penicillin acylase family protein, partial [Streptosporangium algeriense]